MSDLGRNNPSCALWAFMGIGFGLLAMSTAVGLMAIAMMTKRANGEHQ